MLLYMIWEHETATGIRFMTALQLPYARSWRMGLMVDFNSSISKAPAYQSGIAGQGKAGKAGNPAQTTDAAQTGFQKASDVGAVFDKSSALDSIVNQKTQSMLGKTVGQPQLSEKAQKYYDQLKAKFGDMDFILVSKDEKANAQANAASYANPNKPVVLIGEDEVEKMANDESFRKKYEGIISMAKEGLAAMKNQFGDNDNVKGYGMQIDDKGEVSYFAVLKKSNDQQAERLQKKQEAKKAEKKAADKKEAKEAQEDRLEKARSARSEKAKDAYKDQEDFGYEIIRASSIDDLASKVSAFFNPEAAEAKSSYVGGNIDFSA
ncbi:MAG: hypothetical protein IJV16_00600 [Lachnospiraceae bacterium]|nr:hypothetical protein [Lachnospiraceae bacterium]